MVVGCAAEWIDPDDVDTELRECHPAERGGDEGRDLHDPHPGEGEDDDWIIRALVVIRICLFSALRPVHHQVQANRMARHPDGLAVDARGQDRDAGAEAAEDLAELAAVPPGIDLVMRVCTHRLGAGGVIGWYGSS